MRPRRRSPGSPTRVVQRRGEVGGPEPALLRLLADVDLDQRVHGPAVARRAGRQGLGDRQPVHRLDQVEAGRARRAPCWSGGGRSGARARDGRAPSPCPAASWTRFSPSAGTPAATAARIRSTGTVLETATSSTSSGRRPARSAARVMRSRTAVRLARTSLTTASSIATIHCSRFVKGPAKESPGAGASRQARQHGQPAGPALLAVREEQVAPTRGTELRVRDRAGGHTGGDELVGVGTPEIEPPLARGSRRRDPARPVVRERRLAAVPPPARPPRSSTDRSTGRSPPAAAPGERRSARSGSGRGGRGCPATVPRQPAWATARTPRAGSATTTARQSAVNTASGTPGRLVISASASPTSPGRARVGDQARGPVDLPRPAHAFLAVTQRAQCRAGGDIGDGPRRGGAW